MSGNEGAFQTLQSFDEKDLSEFASTGYSGVEKLKGSFLKSWNGGNSTGYFSASGENIDQLTADFNSWKAKRNKTSSAHDEYLKLSKQSPGRKATILVPEKPMTPNTILGGPPSTGKTLLGG